MTRHKRQVLPPGYWLKNGLAKHDLPRPPGLIECDSVADIGAGVRPMQWYQPKLHICVEPHETYYYKLLNAGYKATLVTAEFYLSHTEPIEAIYMLDVIEHMYKDDGWRCVALAMEKAIKQIVIYTPKGFMHQDEDGWDMGGDHWQKHRSGWLPGEFPGWQTSFYGRGFFAIWTPTHN
jgi:hypothetical protein